MKIHFIGVGGMGLSALALYFKQLGNEVSGSDVLNSSMVKMLLDHDVNVKVGHMPVDKSFDVIVKSSAVSDKDPEVLQATKMGIPVLDRMEFFAEYVKPLVGITGTDGKSSTTHMVEWIAVKNGMDPAFLCGAIPKDLKGVNFRMGNDGIIAEVDESDPKIKKVRSEIACLTNLRYDHLEKYGNDPLNQLKTVKQYLGNAHYTVVPDDFDFDASMTFGETGDLSFELLSSSFSEQMFKVRYKRESHVTRLPIVGKHQIYNSLAAIGAGLLLGISLKNCTEALADYPGLRRRLEVIYSGDVCVVDDYAHTPEEVQASIESVKPYFRKTTAIFEPHRYSRFVREHEKFAISLLGADEIFVTDIFGAFESNDKAKSNILAEELRKRWKATAKFVKLEEIVQKLKQDQDPRGVYLFMGAGNLTNVAHKFAKELEELRW